MGRTAAVAALAILGLVFFGCIGAPATPVQVNETAQATPSGNATNIANPASAFCVGKGYALEIRKNASGETGYCKFGNGRECEEWAYYRGECGELGGVKRASAEGEFCGGIGGVACAAGLECALSGDYPDAGGKCERAPDRRYEDCPGFRTETCSMEYEPVCGRAGAQPSLYEFRDYPSACVACSKVSPALGYYGGRCKDLNISTTAAAKRKDTLYDCPVARYDVCTQADDPVCGRAISPTDTAPYYRDYTSPCEACSKRSNAIAYYVGNCSSR